MKRNWIIIVIVVVIIAAAVWLGVSLSNKNKNGAGYSGNNPVGASGLNGFNASGTQVSATRNVAPVDVAVPGMGASSTPKDVAVPTDVAPAAPGVQSSYRSFDIKMDNNQFSPSQIIVNYMDTVHLNLTAVDKNYDFYQPDYGISKQLQKGQTGVIEFQANLNGKLEFYCPSCGGPSSGPIGYITVVGGPSGSGK